MGISIPLVARAGLEVVSAIADHKLQAGAHDAMPLVRLIPSQPPRRNPSPTPAARSPDGAFAVTQHAHHPPKESPTDPPNAEHPVLTIARSVARAITASHRLFPVTSSAYDGRRARPTPITHGLGAGTSAPDPFWKTAPMRNALSCPTGAGNLQSGTVPPSLGLLPRATPEFLSGGGRIAPTIPQLRPLCACSVE